MEDSKLTIKKKYVFIGLIILSLIVGYSLNAALSGFKRPANQAPDNSMASHHKAYMGQSSGFYDSAIGKKAPDFELKDINGETVKLSDLIGKYVVLFFNEGSMCYPSCWNQIAEFAKDERFSKGDVVAFSIVVDSQTQWEQIIRKVPQMSDSKILFDSDRKVSADYDVLFTDSSMHKGSYPGHTYFVIDKDGIIRYTLDDPRMAINNNEIAAGIENLNGA